MAWGPYATMAEYAHIIESVDAICTWRAQLRGVALTGVFHAETLVLAGMQWRVSQAGKAARAQGHNVSHDLVVYPAKVPYCVKGCAPR